MHDLARPAPRPRLLQLPRRRGRSAPQSLRGPAQRRRLHPLAGGAPAQAARRARRSPSSSTRASSRPSASSRAARRTRCRRTPSRERHPADRQAGRASPRPRSCGASSAACGVKVGHLGTLDPFATGLLPLCLGEATKIAQFLNTADKRYEGVIQLGCGDRHRRPHRQHGARRRAVPDLDAATLAAAGGALHRRAAADAADVLGAQTRRRAALPAGAAGASRSSATPRPVRIDRPRPRAPLAPRPAALRVACSKGTYVRVLAEDIGAALGTAAHLETLRRTGFGSFTIAAAVPLDAWDPGRAAPGSSSMRARPRPPARRVPRRPRRRRPPARARPGCSAASRAASRQRRRLLARSGRRASPPSSVRSGPALGLRPGPRARPTFTSTMPCVSTRTVE